MTKWTNERNETTKGMNEMMLRVLKVWPEKKEMTNNNYHTTSMAAVVVWIIIFETSSTGLPVAVSNPVCFPKGVNEKKWSIVKKSYQWWQ